MVFILEVRVSYVGVLVDIVVDIIEDVVDDIDGFIFLWEVIIEVNKILEDDIIKLVVGVIYNLIILGVDEDDVVIGDLDVFESGGKIMVIFDGD